MCPKCMHFGWKSCHNRSYHKYKSKANLISNKHSTFGAPNQYVTMVATMEIVFCRMRICWACAKWKVYLFVCIYVTFGPFLIIYHNDSHKKEKPKKMVLFVQQYIVCLFVSVFAVCFFSVSLALWTMRMYSKLEQIQKRPLRAESRQMQSINPQRVIKVKWIMLSSSSHN